MSQGDSQAQVVMPWAVAAGALLGQHVASRSVRDGIFLSQVGAAQLAQAMLAVAVLMVPAVLSASAGIARYGPGRVTAAVLVASAALFAGEGWLLPSAPVATAWLLYLHAATLGGILISAFFSSLSERFDPHSARRAIGRIMSGASVGGLIGGVLVGQAGHVLDNRALLFALAGLNLACALLVARIHYAAPSPTPEPEKAAGSAFTRLRGSSYLQSLALLVMLTGLGSALLDYGFKTRASASVSSGPELLQLFAAFHTATALLTALLQTTLADRALARFGLSGTLAVLPASTLVLGAFGIALPELWSRSLLRGANSVLESSLFRSAYEPLYTPLSPGARRATKTVIDVAAGRLGEALGSGALLLCALVQPSLANTAVVPLAMGCAAVALLLSLKLHNGYLTELATSLRSGAVKLSPRDVRDSATQLTLSQTMAEVSRAELVAELAALRANQAPGTSIAPVSFAPGADEPAQPAESSAGLLAAAADLASADRARVIGVLERGPLDARLTVFAIPLLRERALVQPVTAALSAIVLEVMGQLVDALHDPRLPLVTRRRIPRVLKSAAHPRAAQGLIGALRAPERELRQRSAAALLELTAQHPELAPPSAEVFELVRDELRAGHADAADLPHLFALLGLALPREALRHARHALTNGDPRQRGTALEYLQNVLPDPLRGELVAQLEAGLSREAGAGAATSRPPSA